MAYGDLTLSENFTMFKQILLNALLKMAQDLIASGKINEYLNELLSKLVGVSASTTAPKVVGCEVKGDCLVFTFDDGKEVTALDLSK